MDRPRRSRSVRYAVTLAAALLLAAPAASFQLPYTATLSIQFGSIAPLVTQSVSRVANVSVEASGRLESVQLTTSAIATTGVQVFPVPQSYAPIGGLQGTFGAWPTTGQQTFARQTNDRLGGVVRVLGVVRVCLFAPNGCPGTTDLLLPLAHAPASFAPYDAAIGWGGTWSFLATPFFAFTVRGAPWTTGTVNPGGAMTGMGFARGPASLPGTTAQNGGQMNLVTPLFIDSTLNGSPQPTFPGVATLAITFTGDPPACANGIDDDGDGQIDAPVDPGCVNENDASEQEASLPCDDGIDNDGDLFTDFPGDPSCLTSSWAREDTQCQDGLNNDADGLIDFDGGAWANGGVPLTAPDPHCVGKPWRNREAPDSCGLGAELLLALGALVALRRRF